MTRRGCRTYRRTRPEVPCRSVGWPQRRKHCVCGGCWTCRSNHNRSGRRPHSSDATPRWFGRNRCTRIRIWASQRSPQFSKRAGLGYSLAPCQAKVTGLVFGRGPQGSVVESFATGWRLNVTHRVMTGAYRPPIRSGAKPWPARKRVRPDRKPAGRPGPRSCSIRKSNSIILPDGQ